MNPIQTSTSDLIILICKKYISSTSNRMVEVRRHIIHLMYVKWGKAANTLLNQEKMRQGFYEAEQVTGITALAITNIYEMMNV
jgi:hypothetical protein